MIPPEKKEEPDAYLSRPLDQIIRKMIHEEITRAKEDKGPKPYPGKDEKL